MTSAIALPPRSRSGAVLLSLLGSVGAFLIAGLGLLTVPVAALLAFGPVLLELL